MRPSATTARPAVLLAAMLTACASRAPLPDAHTLDAGMDAPADDGDASSRPDVFVPVDVPVADAPDVLDDLAVFDATDAADAGDGADVPLFVDAACGARYAEYPLDPGIHIDPDSGTVIVWSTNPPSSGEHYPEWATWGIHTDLVPRPNYVHNLEHGGVVIQYRCDGDCSATRAALFDFVTHLPPEPACVGTGVARRIVVTEDPLTDAPVTASSWGWTYHANCFDPDSLSAFVFARTGHGTEDFCYEGQVP